MTWNYAYTPHIWPPFLTFLLMVALSIFAWRRRRMPGATPFTIACLFAAAWAAGSVMEYAAMDVATKISWVKFQATFQLPYATAVTCFFLEYAWPGRWLTRRVGVMLSIAPLLALGLILTDDLYHLMWQGFTFNGAIAPHVAPVGWSFIAYGYGLGVVNVVVSAWLFIRSPQHRLPVIIMLTGLLAGRLVYLLDRFYFFQLDLPLEVLSIAFAYLMYTIALFGFRLFDPLALARQTIMEQLSDGMLVLDQHGRVASLNPAAERIFNLTTRKAKGMPVQDLLPAYPDEPLVEASRMEIEFSRATGGKISPYRLMISPLTNWRGQDVGRLLLLHDVSEQKQAQARLLEQQQALAMLHEREQLARELHDSTAQVLGFAGFQIEVVQDRLQDGQAAISAGEVAGAATQLTQAKSALARLSSAIEEAHADVREYILNLRLSPSDQRPFFATLQHYLDGFSQNYGLLAELSVDPEIDDEMFHSQAQMHLFRIIQEALSNARKHARASCVRVSFEIQNDRRYISIQDNGQGFDPTQKPGQGKNHFGLRFMQERAAALGGCLRVDSTPGEGTRVIVDLPSKGS